MSYAIQAFPKKTWNKLVFLTILFFLESLYVIIKGIWPVLINHIEYKRTANL
jgi:hypothetical protein